MAYGDYDGPNKPDKGKEGGSCNRTLCQCSPARWWNAMAKSTLRDVAKNARKEQKRERKRKIAALRAYRRAYMKLLDKAMLGKLWTI